MLCFYFTFLDPVPTSALMRSSETKLPGWICTLTPCSFASSGYTSKKIHFICKTCMLPWPWLWVLPFALPSPLKSGDDGQGLEPVVRGWGLGENQTRTSLHRPQVEKNRLSKSEVHPPHKKHWRFCPRANISITQTCFKEPAPHAAVNNCATLRRITILDFTFSISSVKWIHENTNFRGLWKLIHVINELSVVVSTLSVVPKSQQWNH